MVELTPPLDGTLVEKSILMYWIFSSGRGAKKKEWGEWHLGKVVHFYGADNAPRLMHRYNYTVLFDDSSRDLMLLGGGMVMRRRPPPM